MKTGTVKQHHLAPHHHTSEGLTSVYFHMDLSDNIKKQTDLPIHIKQLAVVKINNIPVEAVKVYRDGTGNDFSLIVLYM